MQAIIYKTAGGMLTVIHPAPEAIALVGIDAIAKKDVPAGLPYKIVDVADMPSDRTFRGAWTVDDAQLTDGVGADYGVGTMLDVVGYTDASVVVRHRETGKIQELLL